MAREERRWERLYWFLRKIRVAYEPSAPIRRITEDWLGHHGFRYERLVVEEGNVDRTDWDMLTRNRFQAANATLSTR